MCSKQIQHSPIVSADDVDSTTGFDDVDDGTRTTGFDDVNDDGTRSDIDDDGFDNDDDDDDDDDEISRISANKECLRAMVLYSLPLSLSSSAASSSSLTTSL